MIDRHVVQKLIEFDRYILKGKSERDLKIIERNRYKQLFYCEVGDLHEKNDANNEYLFFRTLFRDDYKDYFDTIFNSIESKNKRMIAEFYTISRVFDFKAFNFFTNHYQHIKKVIEGENTLEASCIVLRVVLYLYLVENLMRINFKTLVLFSDHQPLEYLFSSIAKDNGKLTVTLQHGLYVEYDKIDTINRVNYSNCISEHFLAWGENTRKLVTKYHDNINVHLCGKPQISVSFDDAKQNTNYITLVLDQPLFNEENLHLIKLAMQYCASKHTDLNVRCHPGKTFEKYQWPESDEFSIYNNLEITNSVVVIGHSSTLIFECISLGLPVVQYKSGQPAILLPRELLFDDYESMVERILYSKKISRLDEISKQYFHFTGQKSIEAYSRALSSINCSRELPAKIDNKALLENLSLKKEPYSNWLVSSVKNNVFGKAIIVFIGSEKWLHKTKNRLPKKIDECSLSVYLSFKELESNVDENPYLCDLLTCFDSFRHSCDFVVSDSLENIEMQAFTYLPKIVTKRKEQLLNRIEKELLLIDEKNYIRIN